LFRFYHLIAFCSVGWQSPLKVIPLSELTENFSIIAAGA
jgi:hypothetical protein